MDSEEKDMLVLKAKEARTKVHQAIREYDEARQKALDAGVTFSELNW